MTEIIGIIQGLLKLSPSQLAAVALALLAGYHYLKGRFLASDLQKAKAELFQVQISAQQAKTDAELAGQADEVKKATDAYAKALKSLGIE